VAAYHEQVARAVAPYLRDGHAFLIGPGNAGAIVFRNIFKERGITARVLVAETQGNFCSARITGNAEVVSANTLAVKKIAAYPASDTTAVQKAFDGILETEALANVLETTLNSPNVINHLTATILCSAKIDDMGKGFHLFLHGLTDTVMKGLRAAANEWDAVMKALGIWQMPLPLEHMERVRAHGEYPELDIFRSLDGPDSLKHRYVTEDAGAAITLLVSLARLLKVPVPFTEGLLAIAGALNDTNYYEGGRNLDNLGFGGKTIAEIKEALL
jgi:opine dehydrogenase